MKQHIRAISGFALALLFPLIPARSPITWVFISLAVLGYIAARTMVLYEPSSLARLRAERFHQVFHYAEAIYVTLALVMVMAFVLSMLAIEPRKAIGIGAVGCVVYLIYHAGVLRMLEQLRTPHGDPKPNLIRFVSIATLLAEEGALLASMVTTNGYRQNMVRGPWDWTDAVTAPLFSVVVIIFCYLPIARIGRAATGDDRREAIEALAVHIAALYVFSFTGAVPV